jgi:DNA-binding GntR family transcriptional regulator
MIMSSPREMDPPYLRVAAWLRSEIKSGRLRPGDQVPSATQLGEQFGVSRNTALRALKVLKDEGLIVTQRGWGSFVAGDPK